MTIANLIFHFVLRKEEMTGGRERGGREEGRNEEMTGGREGGRKEGRKEGRNNRTRKYIMDVLESTDRSPG